MNAPAAIQAQLVDVRNVSSHKCVRLEIHVPAEQAGEVMAAFGWPTMADPVPVALARLIEKIKPENRHEEFPKSERRVFTKLSYAAQAALRCNEPDFQRFLRESYPSRWALGNSAAEAIRSLCGVKSRADIHDDPAEPMGSGFRWRSLEAEYFAWQRGRR